MRTVGGPRLASHISRRLAPVEEWIWYLVAGVSYAGLGVWHKWLLNWFIGPAWLVTVVVAGPWCWDRCRDGLRRRRTHRTHKASELGPVRAVGGSNDSMAHP